MRLRREFAAYMGRDKIVRAGEQIIDTTDIAMHTSNPLFP